MKRLMNTLSLGAVGSYLLFRSYQAFRHPIPDLPWFTPHALTLVAGLMLISAFESYRHKEHGQPSRVPSAAADRITRSEKFTFRALGLPPIFAGLVLLGLAGWSAWDQWVTVARWPRTNAILISKDISSVGANLVFQYEARGRRLTGIGSRFGSEKTMRHALETYEPGTIHEISYDPEHPADVQTILNYSWELFMGSISAAIFGAVFVIGGVVVYRWSYGRCVAPVT